MVVKPLTKKQLAMRAKWTEALRSGEYQQGRRALRDGDAFCCLGVACDLYDRTAWDGNAFTQGPWVAYLTLLETVADSFGVGGIGHFLSKANDFGATFDDIADAIDLDTLMRQDGCL